MQEAKQTLQDRTSYYEELEALDKKLEESKDELQKISHALPDQLDTPFLHYTMQQLTSQSGIVFTDIAIGDPADTKSSGGALAQVSGIKSTGVVLGGEGSYEAAKTFLGTLRRSATLYRVDSFSIAASGDDSSSLVKISISLTLYSY